MANSAILSSRFQIYIPKEVRTAQNRKAGQVFGFIPKDGGVPLVPVPDIEDRFGIAKGANPDNYCDRNDRY